jgi:hypothetical protein
MKAKDKPHYVNNKEFSQSVVDYVSSVNDSREIGEEAPKIPEYIGRCFLKIAEGLSHKPNFIGYTYREEMVMDGAENCIKAIMNYDVEKATRTGLPNAFSYFTQIIWYAFLRRIQKEKKYQNIKERYMDHADASQFADFSKTQNYGSIIDRVRLKSQLIRRRDDEVKNFAKLDKKRKNAKKKISSISRSGLELFYL